MADASAGLCQDLDQDAEGAIVLVCGLHDAQHIGIGQDRAPRRLRVAEALEAEAESLAVGDAVVERRGQL